MAKCGSCHTLAQAGTKGIVGPNLDEAFRASIEEGLQRSAVRGVVEGQIHSPTRRAMPKDLVDGLDAQTSPPTSPRSAAHPGKDTGLLASAVEAPGAGKPAVEKAGKLSIAASPSGQLAYATRRRPRPRAGDDRNAQHLGRDHNIAIETGEGGAAPKGARSGPAPSPRRAQPPSA